MQAMVGKTMKWSSKKKISECVHIDFKFSSYNVYTTTTFSRKLKLLFIWVNLEVVVHEIYYYRGASQRLKFWLFKALLSIVRMAGNEGLLLPPTTEFRLKSFQFSIH